MRARYKDPNGTGVVEIDDNATVGTLFEALKAKTSFDHFTVKYGPPASMHTIDMDQIGVIAKSLGLHGETLTIVPSEIPIPLRCKEQPNNPIAFEDDCIIPWPERVGNLVLRVVPSDNSCLFTAFGGAIPGHFQSDKLRQMMADYIAEHPELYSQAVLGCAPVEYQHAIRNPDRWGGGIELSILSTIFDIEICTFDVQGQHLINFGEEKKNRCILIYSGIHYDRVAFSSSDHPHGDTDITIWPTTDSEILEKTRLLVRKLNAGQYYTDTQGLVLKCDQAGCGWIGNGQLAAKQHADLTGHVGMTEIPDLDEDDVLRMCSIPGCNFIGQGRRAIVQHEGDTGHHKFDIIPDRGYD